MDSTPPLAMQQQTSRSQILQLVSFLIENEEFGVDILNVQEIIRPVDITRVPNAPAFVEGVINLRGRIVPVVDLRKRFNLPRRERDKNSRIIVVELGDKIVGFMVDAVREVLRVDAGVIEPPPELAIGIDAHYITGVAKLDDRLLILLDLERILTDEEKHRLQPLQETAEAEAS
ncbi:chemotaxis protein CheW [Rhodothermus marinus]|nr:chemotaxis protein CheW [Rhodothermus marinus]BBM71941.1 chemotaxis protein CheW [Rhodothermus marinus]